MQLIDFGIARRFDPNKRTNTENLGTISYASPEHLGSLASPGQRRSPQNPGKLVQTDARSDIYSLGATMYHLLTNYEPDPIQTPATGSILGEKPPLAYCARWEYGCLSGRAGDYQGDAAKSGAALSKCRGDAYGVAALLAQ